VRKKAKHKSRAEPTEEGVILKIERLGAKGDGMADHQGREVAVPYTLPGETIRGSISGAAGSLEEVLTPSPERISPPCPLFGRCGGCALQHMPRSAERQWKHDEVVRALAREGIADVKIHPSAVFPADARQRAVLAARTVKSQVVLGFRARRSHTIIPLKTCHILDASLFDAISRLPLLLIDLLPEGHEAMVRVTRCVNGFDLDLSGAGHGRSRARLDPDPRVLEKVGSMMARQDFCRLSVDGEPQLTLAEPVIDFDGIAVCLPPGGFLQASIESYQAILDAVRLRIESAVSAKAAIADLFCGSGAFALPLARRYRVCAWDSEGPAIEALTRAAGRRTDLLPVRAQRRDLFRRPLEPDELEDFAAVIVDPPRAGAPQQMRCLGRSAVRHIVYVSCNPKSFARDVRLLAADGYRLAELQLVDQFAYSPHIELVGTLERT